MFVAFYQELFTLVVSLQVLQV